MPTETFRPTRIDSFSGSFTNVGGTTLDIITDDSDATYVRFDSSGSSANLFVGFDASLPGGAAIQEVAVRVRASRAAGVDPTLFVGYVDGAFEQFNVTTTPTEYPAVIDLDEPPWTVSAVNAVDVWVFTSDSAAGPFEAGMRLIEVYLDITYTEGPGVGVLPVGF